MGKILIIVSIVLAAASAGLGFVNRGHLQKTKEDLSASQTEATALKTNLEGEIKKVAESGKQITELTTQKQTLESDLSKHKTDLTAKTSEVTDLKSKLTKAEGDLAAAETDKLSKAEKITKLEEQIASAAATQQTAGPSEEEKARLTELETLNAKLDEDNKNLESKLAALQKAAREKETKQNLTRITGRVLAVNQAWNFVVLSLGNKSGIDSNMEFLVKRGATLIGKIRTTTVEPSTSIADIIPSSLAQGLSIQPGDDIVYQTVQN